MPKEKECRFGHHCTSGCQKDFDCPCQAEHCCALTEDCDRTCDDCFNKEEYKCEDCQDTGIITKVEWTGTDDSHDEDYQCNCQED